MAENSKTKEPLPARLFHSTKLGQIYCGDALAVLHDTVKPSSVDLVMTSLTFGLVRKKEYGNADANEYFQYLVTKPQCPSEAVAFAC